MSDLTGSFYLLSEEELGNEQTCLRDYNAIKVSNSAELLDAHWDSGGAVGKRVLDFLAAFPVPRNPQHEPVSLRRGRETLQSKYHL